MTLTEMKATAADTLAYFIRVMPEVLFSAEDIIIEFAPKGKMVEFVRALCQKYVPDKIINKAQAEDLETNVGANALVGRDKSVIVARINRQMNEQEWRATIFHELTHIYCGKLEMDGEHFIDIYGSGTTPENPNMTPIEKVHDGFLVAGHQVWSEFIAQYYTWKHIEVYHPEVEQMSDYINGMLSSVGQNGIKGDKYAVAFACARWLTCSDTDEAIVSLMNDPYEADAGQKAFEACLFLFHEHIKTEKPWKISKEFITDLGQKYLMFRMLNASDFDQLGL